MRVRSIALVVKTCAVGQEGLSETMTAAYCVNVTASGTRWMVLYLSLV